MHIYVYKVHQRKLWNGQGWGLSCRMMECFSEFCLSILILSTCHLCPCECLHLAGEDMATRISGEYPYNSCQEKKKDPQEELWFNWLKWRAHPDPSLRAGAWVCWIAKPGGGVGTPAIVRKNSLQWKGSYTTAGRRAGVWVDKNNGYSHNIHSCFM